MSLGDIARSSSALSALAFLVLGVSACTPERSPVVVAATDLPAREGGAATTAPSAADTTGGDAALDAAPSTPTTPATGSAWAPAPVPHLARTVFADSELAGQGPPVPLGYGWVAPPSRVTRGSCWVHYEAVGKTAATAFFARNGPGWSPPYAQTDPILGTVVTASRGRSAASVGPRVALADLEVALRARAFTRSSADLLGLVERDFDELDWEVTAPPWLAGNGSLTVWQVSASSRARVPPPAFPPIVRRVVRLNVTFHRDGEIVGINARIDPDVPMCTTARVTADQARRSIRAPGIAGRPLSWVDLVGQPHDAGVVEVAEGGEAVLKVIRIDDTTFREYRLVYELIIQRDGSPWDFGVDAWTGKLFGMAPAFRT